MGLVMHHGGSEPVAIATYVLLLGAKGTTPLMKAGKYLELLVRKKQKMNLSMWKKGVLIAILSSLAAAQGRAPVVFER